MSVPLPSRRRKRLRRYVQHPYLTAARNSPALRIYCARRGYLTPNFSVAEMADTETRKLPFSVRGNARRHCFDLEHLRHRLGNITITINGPYRTPAHNHEVHGAADSRHMHGDASDHFRATVEGWVKASPKVKSIGEVIAICETIFTAIGNETSGTLHLDSRPGKPGSVNFVTWQGV